MKRCLLECPGKTAPSCHRSFGFSPSVGGVVGPPNPTEGEARKGQPAASGCADGEGASCL